MCGKGLLTQRMLHSAVFCPHQTSAGNTQFIARERIHALHAFSQDEECVTVCILELCTVSHLRSSAKDLQGLVRGERKHRLIHVDLSRITQNRYGRIPTYNLAKVWRVISHGSKRPR